MTLLTLEVFFVASGVVLAAVGGLIACDATHPQRWGSAFFWLLLAVAIGAGKWLPQAVVGYVVIALTLLVATKRVGAAVFVLQKPEVLVARAELLGNRLLRRYQRHLRCRHRAKRPAGCSQQYSAHTGFRERTMTVGRQGLKNGIVFAVDGQQFRTTGPHSRHEQSARRNQGFLVCQQNPLPRCCGGKRRAQSGDTDDGSHHC